MDQKSETVKAWALTRVGCPYLMGGTGQPCTVKYREARAAQYPKSAANIKRCCPRMSGRAASCKGCKYYDAAAGKGKPAYDCAQLARAAMRQIGISLVSGSNSQWAKTPYAARGEIAHMPRDAVCLVFRRDGSKMGHVGVYLGDGTVVHARGHAYGVVHAALEDTSFTHYMIPEGMPLEPAKPIPAAPSDQERLAALEARVKEIEDRLERIG